MAGSDNETNMTPSARRPPARPLHHTTDETHDAICATPPARPRRRYARCLMNGSGSLREAEKRPFAHCPIWWVGGEVVQGGGTRRADPLPAPSPTSLAKFCDTLTRSAMLGTAHHEQAAYLTARETALHAFMEREGLVEDAARSVRLLDLMKGATDAPSGEGEEGGGGGGDGRPRRKEAMGITVTPRYLVTEHDSPEVTTGGREGGGGELGGSMRGRVGETRRAEATSGRAVGRRDLTQGRLAPKFLVVTKRGRG